MQTYEPSGMCPNLGREESDPSKLRKFPISHRLLVLKASLTITIKKTICINICMFLKIIITAVILCYILQIKFKPATLAIFIDLKKEIDTVDHIILLQKMEQGSVLGPLLFLLFINDLPNATEFFSLLFADDTTVQMSGTDLNLMKMQMYNLTLSGLAFENYINGWNGADSARL